MKKIVRLVMLILLAFATRFAEAQSVLPVQGAAPNYYVTYKVQPKESLSSIGRLFGTSVGDIMRINGMNTKSKLAVGEKIKIPLTAANVKQSQSSDAISLVHTVVKGDNLYRMSQHFYKVPVDLLKQWNNTGDKPLEIGQQIIIGYLQPSGKVSLDETVAETTPPTSTKQPAIKEKDVQTAAQPVNEVHENTAAGTENIASPTIDSNNTTQKQPDLPATKETAPVVKQPAIDLSNVSEEGYFTTFFGKEVEGRDLKTSSGSAMTFKTASGWADKKYYILMNDVPPGSIVKISSSNTSKTVYAKVLWALGTMKENDGLTYRISNSAASALGISDAKFDLQVVYYE